MLYQNGKLPLQITVEPEPVFVKPVLHLHTMAFVYGSREHAALESQPPLFTWQLSKIGKQREHLAFGVKMLHIINLTCTYKRRSRTGVCIASLARAFYRICYSIMRANGIAATSTVTDVTTI